MLDYNSFEAVVFDMDGVIFDSERVILECWAEFADKNNIKDIQKNLIKCIGTTAGKTREIMLEAYGESFPYDEYAGKVSADFHRKYDGGRLPMKDGIIPLLKFLKENNKRIALASSTKRKNVIDQLTDAGIIKYFDEIITGDMVTRSKPEPDIFLKACEKISTLPKCAYAIEDSYNGIRAASAGGLRPIMVPDIVPADDEMIRLSEVVLKNADEVKEYLAARL